MVNGLLSSQRKVNKWFANFNPKFENKERSLKQRTAIASLCLVPFFPYSTYKDSFPFSPIPKQRQQGPVRNEDGGVKETPLGKRKEEEERGREGERDGWERKRDGGRDGELTWGNPYWCWSARGRQAQGDARDEITK